MSLRTCNLSDAIDQYIGFLRAKRLAENTIKANRYLLNRALACWGNRLVGTLAAKDVDRLFGESNWAETTYNTNLQFIRAFFAWCRNQGYMKRDHDPCFGWRNLRVPQRDKLRIPVEDFPRLLAMPVHPRDRALIAIGLFLFLRSSELQTLRVGDVDFKRNLVHIYRWKTKEEDYLPMCSELREEMLRWTNWFREHEGGLHEQWFLLPAKEGPKFNKLKQVPKGDLSVPLKPLEQMTHPYRFVQQAIAQLGYPTKGEGEHTLRRSGARAMADQLRAEGYDGALLRVASMLGHKDTKQTEHYIGWGLERQQRNEMFAGKPMFGDLFSGQIGELRVIGGE